MMIFAILHYLDLSLCRGSCDIITLTEGTIQPKTMNKFNIKDIGNVLKFYFYKWTYAENPTFLTFNFNRFIVDDILNEDQKEIAIMYNNELKNYNKVVLLSNDWYYYMNALKNILDELTLNDRICESLFRDYSSQIFNEDELSVIEKYIYLNDVNNRYQNFINKYSYLKDNLNNFKFGIFFDMSIEVIHLFYLQFQQIEKDTIKSLDKEMEYLFKKINLSKKKLFVWQNDKLVLINIKDSINYFLKYYAYILNIHTTVRYTAEPFDERRRKTKEISINSLNKRYRSRGEK